jgi:hypothetical protein
LQAKSYSFTSLFHHPVLKIRIEALNSSGKRSHTKLKAMDFNRRNFLKTTTEWGMAHAEYALKKVKPVKTTFG